MTQTTTYQRPGIDRAINSLVTAEAIAFLVAAVLHLGVPIPLGFAVLAEPPILAAVIVEGLCGLFLAVSAYALFTRQKWAKPAAIAAHVFAMAGVSLGMFALAMSRGPRTDLNDVYHRVILVALVSGLALLAVPRGSESAGGRVRTS